MEFVVVFKTCNPAEAQLLCSRLNAAGIPAAVMDELSAQGATVATGGIRIQVPASQADDARALISDPGTDSATP